MHVRLTRQKRSTRTHKVRRSTRGGSSSRADTCQSIDEIKQNLKSKNWHALKMIKNKRNLRYQLMSRSRRASLVKPSEIKNLKTWAQSQIKACSFAQDESKKIRVKQSGDHMILYSDDQSSYWNCNCKIPNDMDEKHCDCTLTNMQVATRV